MRDILNIGLIGIGGFGSQYVKLLLEEGERRGVVFVGAVDPLPEASPYCAMLEERGVPVFPSISDFYSRISADLMVICSPIHFHSEQGALAMEQGSHVLCEKPVSATVQEALELIRVRDITGRLFAVGFQWAYDPAFRQLKSAVLQSKLGKPKRLSSLVLWPRDTGYFARPWAGRIKTKEGRWVWDSIVNNAAAHFLHAMLHLLGKSEELSAWPVKVTAELYRANSIENFDTAALRVVTEDEVEICFYASHAVRDTVGPVFRFEFEEGTVFYNDPTVPESRATLLVRYRNGTVTEFGKPSHNSLEKLWVVVDAIRGRGAIPCPLESGLAHTTCVQGVQESMPDIRMFPSSLINRTGNPVLVWVEGLAETLFSCYQMGLLPFELSVPWARQGVPVRLSTYLSHLRQ